MYADVQTLYETTLKQNPACWMFHNNLGILLTNRGRFDEAIKHFQDALKVYPDYADAHLNLGVALARLGRMEEAITSFQKALKINPDYIKAHGNLANALKRQGRIEEAIAHYRRALEINSDDLQALNNLAWLRDLSEFEISRRRRSGRTGPKGIPLVEWPGADDSRYLGRGVCRGGTISRGPASGSQIARFGEATEQQDACRKRAGENPTLRGSNSLPRTFARLFDARRLKPSLS